jgi:hypothetical protein
MDKSYNINGGFKPTAKRFADLDGPDFFPTPRWATFALIDNEKFQGDIWECACGDGAMSEVLEQTGLWGARYRFYKNQKAAQQYHYQSTL